MKIRKLNAKQTKGPNAKDLIKSTMEPPQIKSKKTCIRGDPKPPRAKRRTKEDRCKEEREDKKNAFLLFLEQKEEEGK